jgi:hypothetical protein
MGDVSNDIVTVCEKMNLDLPDDVWDDDSMCRFQKWLETTHDVHGLFSE